MECVYGSDAVRRAWIALAARLDPPDGGTARMRCSHARLDGLLGVHFSHRMVSNSQESQ